jgi:hypothetical protein
MDHVLDHQVVDFRFCVRIRVLSREKRVNTIRCPEFGFMIKEDDEMHVYRK